MQALRSLVGSVGRNARSRIRVALPSACSSSCFPIIRVRDRGALELVSMGHSGGRQWWFHHKLAAELETRAVGGNVEHRSANYRQMAARCCDGSSYQQAAISEYLFADDILSLFSPTLLSFLLSHLPMR